MFECTKWEDLRREVWIEEKHTTRKWRCWEDLDSGNSIRTGAKGRSQQPRGFRRRRKRQTIEKSEQINRIRFLRAYPQKHFFPLGLKFSSDGQLTPHLRTANSAGRSLGHVRWLDSLLHTHMHTPAVQPHYIFLRTNRR